jgi:PPK2 family polyphosphate:nucleotide phosphotransferase
MSSWGTEAYLPRAWGGNRYGREMAKQRSATDLLRAPSGGVDLRAIDPRSTPAAEGGGKSRAAKLQADLALRLAELQEMLYAHGRTGGRRSLLLVLQGLDTSGKSGTIAHVIGQIDPQGADIAAFKAPTAEERRHDFLWRIRRRAPEPGMIGVFDRSHYEDVLVVRVRNLAPRSTWSKRYDAINRFEAELAERGTTIVKCFLHISFEEWRERQLARVDDPTKYWKYNPADLDDGALWGDYLDAYQDAIERCGTETAPWHVVPADRKWHRNLAVTRLLIEHLEAMQLGWPPADFDPAAERKRICAL